MYRRLIRVLLVAAVVATPLAVSAAPASAASGGGCRNTGAIGSCISYDAPNQRVAADFYMNQTPGFSRCKATMTIYVNGRAGNSKPYDLTRTGRYGPIYQGVATIPPSRGSAYNRVIIYDCLWRFHHVREARSRLHPVQTTDPAADVRAAFSWSYAALDSASGKLFRRLGLHPTPEFGLAAAAAVAGMPAEEARGLLDRLTEVNLVSAPQRGRYRMHDLLHEYAWELADAVDGLDARAAALHRLLDHYLTTTRVRRRPGTASATSATGSASPSTPCAAMKGRSRSGAAWATATARPTASTGPATCIATPATARPRWPRGGRP